LLPESDEAFDSEEDLTFDELSEEALEDLSAVSDEFSLLVFSTDEAPDFLLDEPWSFL
tara:strand:+ start:380 stop:553 length:174 start_codon:yes stop_codon:yes gene_type:complete